MPINTALFTNPQIGAAYGSDPRLGYAQALMQGGASTAPVQSWGEGLARALQGGLGGYQAGQVRRGYQAQDASYQKGLATALQGGDVLAALQTSSDPTLQQMGLEAKLKQAMEKPAKDGLVKVYDPATKTDKYVRESEAAGLQADGPQGPKIGDTRNYQIGGNKVTDQWDGTTWQRLGSGPAWDPNGNQGNAYFGTPVPMVGPDGKAAIGMLGKDGKLHVAAADAGYSPAPGVTYGDTGTALVPLPKNAGITLPPGTGPVPIDVGGKAAQSAAGQTTGTAQGTATANLPATIDSANNALSEIAKIKSDPSLGTATGLTGMVLNNVPGTDSKGLALRVEQLKGGAFLQAFNTLKGAGAISEIEGAKATAALARLDLSQNKKDFLQALDDYQAIISQGVQRLQNMSQGNFSGATAGPQPAQAPPDISQPLTATGPNGQKLVLQNGQWVPK